MQGKQISREKIVAVLGVTVTGVFETGKLINGRDVTVVVTGVVRDSEELERERGKFISGKEAVVMIAVAVMGKAESETGKLISEKVAVAVLFCDR